MTKQTQDTNTTGTPAHLTRKGTSFKTHLLAPSFGRWMLSIEVHHKDERRAAICSVLDSYATVGEDVAHMVVTKQDSPDSVERRMFTLEGEGEKALHFCALALAHVSEIMALLPAESEHGDVIATYALEPEPGKLPGEIVLIDTEPEVSPEEGSGGRYATWLRVTQEDGFTSKCWGHYFRRKEEAVEDYFARCRRGY